MGHLYDAQDPVQFEKESVALQKAFDGDVDRANRALEMLPPGTWRDAEFSSLEAVRTQFATQLSSLNALARQGDWTALRQRAENRLPVIGELSEGLVRDIDYIVDTQKKQALLEIRRAQSPATCTLLITGLLALLAAAALGMTVIRNIAAPLAKLDAAARS